MRHLFQLLAQRVHVENFCFGSEGRRPRLLKRKSLHTRLSLFFASDLFLLPQAQSLVFLAFGLAHSHPADVMSLNIVLAGHFYDESWDLQTKTCGVAKRSAARKRGKKRGREAGAAERVYLGVFL